MQKKTITHRFVHPDYKPLKTDIPIEFYPSKSKKSACESALTMPLRKDAKQIIVNHADSDTAFATAVLECRYAKIPFNAAIVKYVGKYDRTGFTYKNAQLLQILKIFRGLHVIYAHNISRKYDRMVAAAMCVLRGKPIKDANKLIRTSAKYREFLKRFIPEVRKLLDDVVFIRCKNFGAIGYGYERCHASIVIAYNKRFYTRYETYAPKFTIAKKRPDVKIDLGSVMQRLNNLEAGWGGHPTQGIIGSPLQGSKLDPDQVIKIVVAARKKALK